jgi:hypothetical protein
MQCGDNTGDNTMGGSGDKKGKTQIIVAVISGVVSVFVAVISTMATIYTKDSTLKDNIVKIDSLDPKTQEIQSKFTKEFPIGSILPFAGELDESLLDELEKAGWLPCKGDLISKAKYGLLYKIIGTTYGSSDQLGWFRLLNLSGRLVMGAGKGEGLSNRIVGQYFGAERHSL